MEYSPSKMYETIELLNRSPLLAFHNMTKKYGPIVRMQMGGKHAIILGGLYSIMNMWQKIAVRHAKELFLSIYFLVLHKITFWVFFIKSGI